MIFLFLPMFSFGNEQRDGEDADIRTAVGALCILA